MIVKLIPVDGPEPLLAYLFRRDLPEDDRLWVCVQAAGAQADAGWLGCWSSQNRLIDEKDLRDFVQVFCERMRLGVRAGPYGVFLDEHYFFDGWDAWGAGTPLHLEGRNKRREIVEAATADHPLGSFARQARWQKRIRVDGGDVPEGASPPSLMPAAAIDVAGKTRATYAYTARTTPDQAPPVEPSGGRTGRCSGT